MRMNRKYKKNGLIELMRFVFASIIIIFHVNKDLWNREIVLFRLGGFRFTPAQNGNIGVDFFFLVSGALMAMTIYRLSRTEQETSIGVETAGYIWKSASRSGCIIFRYVWFLFLYVWPRGPNSVFGKFFQWYLPCSFCKDKMDAPVMTDGDKPAKAKIS